MQQNFILNYLLPHDNFNMIFWKNSDTAFHSFQQLAFRRIKRVTGSYKAAMEDIKQQEKEAQRQIDQITRTCQGLLQYIDLLRVMQKIPDL